MEEKIKLAEKLYKCRDACKSLFGVTWKEEIQFHTELIGAAMKKHKIDCEIKAAMQLVEDSKDMSGAGVFAMKVFAAAVEIVEPSN